MKKYSILFIMAFAFLLMVGFGNSAIAGEKCCKADTKACANAKADCAKHADCAKRAECTKNGATCDPSKCDKSQCKAGKCDMSTCKAGKCDMSKCKPAGTTEAPKAETKK